jgi:hypothetical protein
MEARLLVVTMSIALAAALTLAGCGDGHSEAEEHAVRVAFEESAKRCQTLPDEGTYDQVRLHNSGVTCQEAVAMIYVLAGGAKRPQRITGGPGPAWYCLDLPSSRLPLEIRCHQGQQYFTVERVKAAG